MPHHPPETRITAPRRPLARSPSRIHVCVPDDWAYWPLGLGQVTAADPLQNGASHSTARIVTGPSSERVFSGPSTSADALAMTMETMRFGYRITSLSPDPCMLGRYSTLPPALT